MTDGYCIIMTTTANAGDAEKLTVALLERKLAACVQHMPIKSYYTFENQAFNEPEVLLLIKTRRVLYDKIEVVVRDEHPYKVPELVLVPIDQGFAPYLNWIDENTIK